MSILSASRRPVSLSARFFEIAADAVVNELSMAWAYIVYVLGLFVAVFRWLFTAQVFELPKFPRRPKKGPTLEDQRDILLAIMRSYSSPVGAQPMLGRSTLREGLNPSRPEGGVKLALLNGADTAKMVQCEAASPTPELDKNTEEVVPTQVVQSTIINPDSGILPLLRLPPQVSPRPTAEIFRAMVSWRAETSVDLSAEEILAAGVNFAPILTGTGIRGSTATAGANSHRSHITLAKIFEPNTTVGCSIVLLQAGESPAPAAVLPRLTQLEFSFEDNPVAQPQCLPHAHNGDIQDNGTTPTIAFPLTVIPGGDGETDSHSLATGASNTLALVPTNNFRTDSGDTTYGGINTPNTFPLAAIPGDDGDATLAALTSEPEIGSLPTDVFGGNDTRTRFVTVPGLAKARVTPPTVLFPAPSHQSTHSLGGNRLKPPVVLMAHKAPSSQGRSFLQKFFPGGKKKRRRERLFIPGITTHQQ